MYDSFQRFEKGRVEYEIEVHQYPTLEGEPKEARLPGDKEIVRLGKKFLGQHFLQIKRRREGTFGPALDIILLPGSLAEDRAAFLAAFATRIRYR